jgi:hypothetical protein
MATETDTQLEFNLGEDEVETDVSLLEANKTEEVETTEPSVVEQNAAPSNREELETVNDAVQKRIAKLTARMREAERREQAAIEYAKGLQTQTQTLQQKLVHTDYSRLNEAKTRLDTQQTALKSIIRKAREEGDIDTETEANQRLTDLIMEQRQVAGWLQSQEQQVQSYQQPQSQQPQQPQNYQQPPPQPAQRPAPSPQAEEWAERNPWFGQDRMLTYAAWGIHETLITQEGIDPNSEEYYTELDRRLQTEFPSRFQNSGSASQIRQQRAAPAVAPATRSSGINSARRTVRLSPSQVAIAKKLGVPLEEYAKYVKE